MSEELRNPRLGRVSSDNADVLISMLDSSDMFEAIEVTQKIVIDLVSDILSKDPEAWSTISEWIAKCAEGTSLQRWAALGETTLIARNALYAINGKPTSQESEEEMQEIFSIFNADDPDSQTGIRDGLFMLSLTVSENQGLEPDWLWYATSDCPSERFFGATIVMFFSIASSVVKLSQSSDLEPVELWSTFSLLIS